MDIYVVQSHMCIFGIIFIWLMRLMGYIFNACITGSLQYVSTYVAGISSCIIQVVIGVNPGLGVVTPDFF